VRLLLAQNIFFHRTHGGAGKANRILIEELAARGHTCHVVAPLTGELGRTTVTELLRGLADQNTRPETITEDTVVARLKGVRVHFVTSPSALAKRARELARELQPDWILVPSDDPGLIMLGVAASTTPGRVVYLAHTLQQLPFGPSAFYPSETGTRLVRQAAGVVAVSEATRRHLRTWGGVDSVLIHPHVYGPGPFPVSRGDAVTMINPCGYKGISIFLDLADRLPGVPFLAVPTWGTTEADLAALAARPNIEIAEPADDINEVLARARLVVMPSLWDESFGYTAVEAMLRGIPVVAARIGGLREAKLGVPYSLPVRRIQSYLPRSGSGRPEPVIPQQDVGPWLTAVRSLLDDADHYSTIAARSRAAATAFVESLDTGRLEGCLLDLNLARPDRAAPSGNGDRIPADRHRLAALAQLLTRREH
jgi:glycosyltransferase involved in cell wall biosynthesis